MAKFSDTASILHRALAEDLISRIQSGTATAAELNVARQFLKDNGVDSLLTEAEQPVLRLASVVPFQDPDVDAPPKRATS
jgi:hypothetical protein